MSRVFKQSNTLKYAIITSMIFHIIAILLLIWNFLNEKINVIDITGNTNNIDAVMVDFSDTIEQHRRQQNQQIFNNHIKQQPQTQTQQQIKKQVIAEQYLEEGNKEHRQIIQQKTKQHKKEQYAKQHQVKETIKPVNEKQKIVQQTKIESQKNKKIASPEIARDSSVVNNLLSDLLLSKNTSKTNLNDMAKLNTQEKFRVSDTLINNYLGQVKIAIQNKFYDANTFKGRVCVVRIKLAPDGFLISAMVISGDTELCNAAINATRIARIPKPPNQDVWREVNDTLLEFKP